MYIKVRSSLVYHRSALETLYTYLRSEYRWLQYGDANRVEYLERAITRLVQNAFENQTELERLLDGISVRQFAAEQDEQLGRPLLDLANAIEQARERCRDQASRNRALARILDQGQMIHIGAMYGVPPHDLEIGSDVRVH